MRNIKRTGIDYKMSNKTPFKYNINEIVNDSLKIKKQTNNKRYEKIYEVQSISYPKAPTYFVTEYSLANGTGCAYVSHRRICEQNSLYSIESVKPYLVDIEEAKKIAPKSSKKITMKCPDCKKEKKFSGKRFFNEGFSCPMCRVGVSYPELFFASYAEVKNIKLEYQKIFKGLPNRRFDFYSKEIGVIETHGSQHYDGKGFMNSETSKKSDKEKMEFCLINKIKYVVLDCRESTFTFIKDSINRCDDLPNITNEDEEKIIERIKKSKVYPINDIVDMYCNGHSSVTIANKYNISSSTVRRILKKCKITIRDPIYKPKKIKCVNTGVVFNSIEGAASWCGLKSSSGIRAQLDGIQETAGRHPETNEKLLWLLMEN